MKKVLSICGFIVLAILLVSSVSFAAGFRIPDQDSAALGMAGAFVGQADNPSAVWYNPAGITQLDGTRIAGGIIAIAPLMEHENTDGTIDVSKRAIFLPLQLFATHKMNDTISLGLGITSPFGLSTNWAATSSTSNVATFSKIETIDINPTIAYKVTDALSLAIGIDYMKLQATMEKIERVVLPGPVDLGNHNFRLKGDGAGWGANAAIKFRQSEKLDIGLTYRSRIKVDVDGTAELTGGPAATSGSASTAITLPDLIQAGLSYKASDRLTINADLDYTMWSTYDRLVITSSQSLFNATEEKGWKNVWALRIGGQYKLSDQWKLRAGYVYDQNPVPADRLETSLPDSDRQGITIGGGYTIGNVTVDAAYMYLKFKDRSITNSTAGGTTVVPSLNGNYKSEAHLVGVTLAYQF